MSLLDRITQLPEGADPAVLRPYFLEIVAAPAPSQNDEHALADALADLADRQWHTYEPLAPDLRALTVG